jgi:hypothetical protein
VHGEIGLTVAIQVKRTQSDSAVHGGI